jgi:hypothetical protein
VSRENHLRLRLLFGQPEMFVYFLLNRRLLFPTHERTPGDPTEPRNLFVRGTGSLGSLATDGQRAIYIDYGANALMIGDADGSHGRVIYKTKPGESFSHYHGLAPSRDLSMVFFRLVASDGQVRKVRECSPEMSTTYGGRSVQKSTGFVLLQQSRSVETAHPLGYSEKDHHKAGSHQYQLPSQSH